MLPDENDLDFTWSITDDGGGILVTPAVQNLTVNLEETQRHVVPIQQRLSPSIHLYINLPFCHLLLTSPPPPTHQLLLSHYSPPHLYYMVVHYKNPAQHQLSFKW